MAAPRPAKQTDAPRKQSGSLNSAEIFSRLHRLAFGVQSLEPAASQAHEQVAEAARIALEEVSGELRYTPRRPLLLPQLMRAVNDSDASRKELSSIIARDPALAGTLLKLANSAFYRVKAQPVESIDRAVALLGTEGIRSLISAALVQPVFRVSSGSFSGFADVAWEHTFLAANAAEAHAATVESADPFAAQLLAMVMGLGSIMTFRAAMDQYAERTELRPNATTVATLIDQQNARVARRVAAGWELSERMLAALEEQSTDAASQESTPLGRSLRFGLLAGAVALLYKNKLIEETQARATLGAGEGPSPQFDQLWARLTAA